MISERRGDGEIRLGVESDMEIEEGEACFYHNGDDTSFDPDVSLSYIDDKIKDILGHFQKDFEGGVSAENLGAKFGGYGSFLPTYARSPAGSQRRTTSEVLDGNTHKSPRILDFEASHLSSLASSCSPLPLRLEGSTTNPNDLRSINGRVKREGRVPFNSVETPTSKVEQKSELPYDQRTLKVRLKVGSNNLPARKIAEIYSGLGLDGSPSPSLNDRCTDGEGLSHDISDPSGNSPTSILKIMTSFLQGDQLLSPLSEELVHFTVKGKYSRESACKPLHKKKVSGYDSRKDLHEPLPEKKTDSYENGEFLEEVKPSNGGFLLKRETGMDDLACEDLVTNALKLPLLSTKPGPPRYAEGTVKTADLPRASNEGPSSMTQAEEQTLECESVQEIERIQKPKGNVGLSVNISIHKKENLVDNCNVAKKPSKHKEKRNIVSGKVESGLPVQERAPGAGLFDSRETKIIQADVSSNDLTGNQSQGEEQLGATGRKKLEGGQSHDSLNNFESYDNGSHVNSLLPKNLLPKNVSGNTSKGLKKITNKYAEFFGDLDFEQDDIDVPSKELSSVKTGMDSKLEENGSTLADTRIAKETSSGKKSRKPNKAEEFSRASSKENVSSIAAEPKSDAILSAPAPELEDNWVQCDKCQKWRLLPLGRNTSSFPEKWLCKMLDWLPAMNRCTFSEEETTNAARALYQILPPLVAEGKPPGHTGNSLSMISSTSVSNSAHNRRMLDQQTSQTGVNKKHKSKYESGRPVYAEPLQHSKSMKNHEEKNNGMNHSSQVDSYGNQYVGQPSSSLAEKHANKVQKESSVEVDAKKLKARKRGLGDSDSSRSSKKVKSQDGHCLGHSSPEHIPRKDKRTIDGRRKEVNDEFRNHVAATEITYDASLPDYKGDGKSSSKKNKAQGEQGTRSYVGNITQAGHQSLDRSGDTERKVKKARLSNSEGKDVTTKKATSDSGRKDRKSIDQQIGRERGSSGNADSSKRDLGSVHPSVPSTSSSSKVSGSCKIKMSRLKVKGSPVESVSSSPLRVLSSNNRASTSGNPQEKDDRDHIFVDNCSPRGSLVVATNKMNHSSGTKIREENRSSSDYATQPVKEAGGRSTQDSSKNRASERYQDERKEDQTLNSGFHSRKLENGMSLHGNCIISENGKAHVTSPVSNKGALDDIPLSNEKFTGGRSRFQESSVSFDKDEKNFISEKSSRGKDLGGISDHENKSAPGCNVHSDDKLDEKESTMIDRDGQDSSNKLFSDIRNASEVSDSGKAHSLPPSTRYKNDRRAHHSLVPASHEENGVDIAVSDAHGDTSKALEHNRKGEKQNGSTPSRHSNLVVHKVRDHDGSAVRKDSRSQAATTAMKEAKDLKRLADRFKNSGSADSTGMYFEAALKFLQGASLLECGSRENSKHNDMQCIDMYRSTAKFCEFCAHEYERSKDMASAALAYKCMEVSYMRVIYASHGSTSRDRNEVQMALQIVPPGESPASSVSDVDNLNNPVIVDKVSASKGMTSPQVAGSSGITARNRSCFTWLLEFAQDVSAAMDAARKSRATLAAANFRSGDANCGDGFSSVKRALDFDFQDVDGFLRLIRIAKDAVSH